MIIHNIYIISSEGICPLSIKLGSIDTDPQIIAGVFAASQKFWAHLTGEDPQSINFHNLKAHLRQFSTGEKNWYLVIILEFENPQLLRTVEKSILEVVMKNKEIFEKFVADTNEISVNVKNQILERLRKIRCPYLQVKIFKHFCKLKINRLEKNNCNIIAISDCKEKIKEQLHPIEKKVSNQLNFQSSSG